MAEIGIVEEVPYKIKQNEWRIEDCFTVFAENRPWFESPSFFADDGATYFFRLFPRWMATDEFIHLYLQRNVELDYPIAYHFGLKKCDGSVLQLVHGILKSTDKGSGVSLFIKRTILLDRKSELAPSNILTITCTMTFITERTLSIQQTLEETKPLQLIKLDKLSENFKDLFNNKESSDVILKVQDKEYNAHKSVLIARSSVFAANFKHDMLEKQTGVITITDCDPISFREFLEYLYSGKLEDLSVDNALNLYYTSDKYDVEELKTFCVSCLVQCLTVENLCEIAAFADKFNESHLFSVVQEFFNEHSLQIFLTSGWDCLMKDNYRLGNKLLSEMSKKKLKQ